MNKVNVEEIVSRYLDHYRYLYDPESSIDVNVINKMNEIFDKMAVEICNAYGVEHETVAGLFLKDSKEDFFDKHKNKVIIPDSNLFDVMNNFNSKIEKLVEKYPLPIVAKAMSDKVFMSYAIKDYDLVDLLTKVDSFEYVSEICDKLMNE